MSTVSYDFCPYREDPFPNKPSWVIMIPIQIFYMFLSWFFLECIDNIDLVLVIWVFILCHKKHFPISLHFFSFGFSFNGSVHRCCIFALILLSIFLPNFYKSNLFEDPGGCYGLVDDVGYFMYVVLWHHFLGYDFSSNLCGAFQSRSLSASCMGVQYHPIARAG